MNRVASLIAWTLVVAAVGCEADTAAPEEPVWVSPVEPAPDDAITVRARTLYGEGQRGDGSNYHFHLTGPAGQNCAQHFRSSIGMFGWERRSTERNGEIVVRHYYPTRGDTDPLAEGGGSTTWCPGTYHGAVEWRGLGENDRFKRRTLATGIEVFGNLIGTYTFEVQRDSATGS